MSSFLLLGLMGTVKVRLVWNVGTMPDRWRSLSEPGVPSLVPLSWRCRRGVSEAGAVMGLKFAGRKPNNGEGDGDGVGEKGDWLEMGENEGVPEREPPSETSIVAASHSSKSKRERSWGSSEGMTRRGRESPPRLLASLLSRDVSSQSNSELARPPPSRRSDGVRVPVLLAPPRSRTPPLASISFVLIERCLEQYPRRWDSLEQPSREQRRLHCFPLNFLRMPVGVQTTSPFLYFCWAAVSGVRERDEEEEVEPDPDPPLPPAPPPEEPPPEAFSIREVDAEEEEMGGSGGSWGVEMRAAAAAAAGSRPNRTGEGGGWGLRARWVGGIPMPRTIDR